MSTPPHPTPDADDDLSWAQDAPAEPWPLDGPDDEDPDGWLPPDPPPPPLVDLAGPDDTDDGSWDLPPAAEPPVDFADADERPAIPWLTHARWVEGARDIPTVLDPTAAHSVMTLPEVGSPAPLTLTLALGEQTISLTVQVTAGSTFALRLGRDALAGRVTIRV